MKKKQLTMGSLFSGSGTFEFAAEMAGIVPKFNSEISPFPIRVTTKRFPDVKFLGDVSKVSGAEIDPIDILTFGSPCQDLSIAGRRAGLAGERSGLFHQAMRIVSEMQAATNGEYPRYLVWENVLGAFSSNEGKDFRQVLQEIVNVTAERHLHVPQPKEWLGVGCIMGDTYSIAWRTFDSQYWGVPQRRKRIYLVTDIRGKCAKEILFDSEGLPWNPPQSFHQRKNTSGHLEESIGETEQGCDSDRGFGVGGGDRGHGGRGDFPVWGIAKESFMSSKAWNAISITKEKSSTLEASAPNGVACPKSEPKVFGICAKDSNAMKSDNPHSGFYEAQTSRTLDMNGGNPGCNQGGMAIVEPIKTYDVRFTSEGTKNSRGHCYETDISRCLDSGGEDPDSNHGGICVMEPHSPKAFHSSKNSHHTTFTDETYVDTLVATDYKDPPIVSIEPEYIVRRLTPIECARLQGMPDWWCDDLGTENPTEEDVVFWRNVFLTWNQITKSSDNVRSDAQIIKWLKNPYSESEEYKMWGNGVTLPVVFHVLSSIKLVDEKDRK